MKLKATGKAGARGMTRGLVLSLGTFLPVGYWGQEAFNWVSLVLFLMGAATVVVWAAVNLADLPEWLAERELEGQEAERRLVTARRPRPCLPPDDRVLVQDGRMTYADGRMIIGAYADGSPVYDDPFAAVRRAYQAGTLSVNGRRYAGPPPPGYGRGSRVSKSECDECGAPMDVAWCGPETPYLCQQCFIWESQGGRTW